MSAATVDIWWTRGTEATSTSDATIHCRASSVVAGIPPSWRTGERRLFLDTVLAKYAAGKKPVPPLAGNQFSLSDSGTILAIGVGTKTPLGIDIERQRAVDDALQTLRGLGLTGLAARLSQLAPAARNKAFLRLWTAFEAFLKLERLKWETGAERFAALAPYWLVGAGGHTEFRGHDRAGVAFQHFEVPGELIIAAATPRIVPAVANKINVALRHQIALS